MQGRQRTVTIKSLTILIVCLWTAFPKYYVHELLHHSHHSGAERSSKPSITPDDECGCLKFDKTIKLLCSPRLSAVNSGWWEEIRFFISTAGDPQISESAATNQRGPPVPA